MNYIFLLRSFIINILRRASNLIKKEKINKNYVNPKGVSYRSIRKSCSEIFTCQSLSKCKACAPKRPKNLPGRLGNGSSSIWNNVGHAASRHKITEKMEEQLSNKIFIFGHKNYKKI